MYTVSYVGTLTTAGGDSDLFNIAPADDKMCRLRGLVLSNYSEFGDAQEEALHLSIMRLPATVSNGSGGSSVTPVAIDSHAAAMAFTARANDTTLASTTGTAVTLEEFAWNERITPLERWWMDDLISPIFYQGEALVVRLQTTPLPATPLDDLTAALTVYIEEF